MSDKYLTEDQISALRDYVRAHSYNADYLEDYISKRSEPKYEEGKVYVVSFNTDYGVGSEFLQWTHGEFRNAGGERASDVAAGYWDVTQDRFKIIGVSEVTQ